MWLGQITLDPIAGAIVAGELERLELSPSRPTGPRRPCAWAATRPRPIWPAPRASAGPTPWSTWPRARPPCPPTGRRPAPLFSVFVGYETLHGRICELAQGTAVTPGSLLPWLESGPHRAGGVHPARRVEIGAQARLFTGATRRAIELRDRRCTHAYCDRPAYVCQVDHIVPYAQGGPTTQDNGRLLCGFHNRLRNARPPPD